MGRVRPADEAAHRPGLRRSSCVEHPNELLDAFHAQGLHRAPGSLRAGQNLSAEMERARVAASNALTGRRVLTRDALLATVDATGVSTRGQRGYHPLVRPDPGRSGVKAGARMPQDRPSAAIEASFSRVDVLPIEADFLAVLSPQRPAGAERGVAYRLQNPLLPSAIGRGSEPSAGTTTNWLRPVALTRGMTSDALSGDHRLWLRAYWSK